MTPFERLSAEGYTCIIETPAAVVTSRERGIRPLLDAIAAGTPLRGGRAADTIVGKAAALLYVYMGVSSVEAAVMSHAGAAVLAAHGIAATAHTLTDRIQNRRGDGICPMEETVQTIDDPAEALAALRQTVARLRAARS